MANVKSVLMTQLDTNIRPPDTQYSGLLRESCSVVVTAADQSASDDLMFVPIASNARVSQVLVSHDDATTGGAIDIGIWSRTFTDGAYVYAAVDDDLFASAYALTAGPVYNFDVTNESTEYTPTEQSQMLWEVLGLSTDPNLDYVIASDITTVFNGGPLAITLKVRYVV